MSSECQDITVTLVRLKGRNELKFIQKTKWKEKVPENGTFVRSMSWNTNCCAIVNLFFKIKVKRNFIHQFNQLIAEQIFIDFIY